MGGISSYARSFFGRLIPQIAYERSVPEQGDEMVGGEAPPPALWWRVTVADDGVRLVGGGALVGVGARRRRGRGGVDVAGAQRSGPLLRKM